MNYTNKIQRKKYVFYKYFLNNHGSRSSASMKISKNIF